MEFKDVDEVCTRPPRICMLTLASNIFWLYHLGNMEPGKEFPDYIIDAVCLRLHFVSTAYVHSSILIFTLFVYNTFCGRHVVIIPGSYVITTSFIIVLYCSIYTTFVECGRTMNCDQTAWIGH